MYTNKEDPRKIFKDNIYYDARIYNNTNLDIPAEYNASRESFILDRPSDYYCFINRFSISHLTIPIFIFEENIYSVTIQNNLGVNFQTFLTFINRTSDPDNRSIYYYNQFVEMINNALNLSLIAAGLLANDVFVRYDPITNLFSVLFNTAVDWTMNSLFFSTRLFQLFQEFEANFLGYNSADGTDYQILEFDYGNNTVSAFGNMYFEMKQELQALYLWNAIQNIIFVSNSLPIRKEYITDSNNPNSDSSRPIISDFVPNLNVGRDLSQFQFYQQGDPRLIDLISDSPINNLNFKIFYQFRDGTTTPLLLEPNEVVSVKFVFARKSIYNNAYSLMEGVGKLSNELYGGIDWSPYDSGLNNFEKQNIKKHGIGKYY